MMASVHIKFSKSIAGTVVEKTTDPQRKFPRENFNPPKSLSQKNIASDLIYVDVLIQVNITRDAVQNFYDFTDGKRMSHPDDP